MQAASRLAMISFRYHMSFASDRVGCRSGSKKGGRTVHEALIFILINTIARDLIKAKTVTISSDYADSRADTKGEEGKRDQAEW